MHTEIDALHAFARAAWAKKTGRPQPPRLHLSIVPYGNDTKCEEFKNNMNWEVILWTCVTIAVLLIVVALAVSIMSARNMRKSRERMAQLQSDIKVGASIMFGGGIFGKIVKIKDDLIDVEVSKGVVIQISRYAIQTVE